MELKRMAECLNSTFLRVKAKQLLAVMLAVLMVIPVTGYGVVAHAQETKTITAFAHLAEEAKTIIVPTGALEEELPLPETLTATVERIVYEETTAGSSNPAQEESKETEPTEPTEGGSAEGTESKTEPVAKKVTEDVALAVTWESDKPFTSETADTFTYTAKVTEESYVLAESVSLPKICVQIENSRALMLTSPAGDGEASVTDSEGTPHSYDTLEDAITAAQGMRNSTLTLLTNVDTESTVTINNGTFTIDLNGKTWISTAESLGLDIGNGSHVTLKDGAEGGKFTATAARFTINTLGASLTIESGIYENESGYFDGCILYANNCATVTIQGGTFQSKKPLKVLVYFSQANVSISGGEFSGNKVSFYECNSVALSGGTYACIEAQTFFDLLASGYGYKVSGGTWVNNPSDKLLKDVTVQLAPVQITEQPKNTSETYGFTSAPALSVVAKKTVTAPEGSNISYQWYMDDTSIDSATDSSCAIPTDLDAGTYSFYCAVSCDGYTINSEKATVTITQSGTSFEDGIKTYNGAAVTNDFIYGDTITVKAKPRPTGIAPKTFALTSPLPNQMALFIGDTQITDPQMVTSGTELTFTIDTTQKAIPASMFTGTAQTLTAKYVGNDNMADYGESISITLSKQEIKNAALLSSSKTYDGTRDFPNVKIAFFAGSGVVDGDDIKATCTAVLDSSANVNVGSNKIIRASGDLVLSGSHKDYYSLRISTVGGDFATISKKLLTSDMMENVDDITYTGTQHQPTLVVTDGAPDTIKPSDYTVSYGENINAGPGTVTIAATESGNYYGETYQAFTIRKAVPTVTLKAITREDAPFIYGNEIYFTAVVTGVNSEKPDGTVTLKDGNDTLFSDMTFFQASNFYQKSSDSVTAGNHSFTAVYTPSTDGIGKNYVGVTSAVVEQTIAKADQSISITEVNGKKYKGADFTLETTGGKGTGAVTFSVPVDNGVLSVDGNTATIIGAGTVLVTATKAADTNYNSITTTREITIGKAAV